MHHATAVQVVQTRKGLEEDAPVPLLRELDLLLSRALLQRLQVAAHVGIGNHVKMRGILEDLVAHRNVGIVHLRHVLHLLPEVVQAGSVRLALQVDLQDLGVALPVPRQVRSALTTRPEHLLYLVAGLLRRLARDIDDGVPSQELPVCRNLVLHQGVRLLELQRAAPSEVIHEDEFQVVEHLRGQFQLERHPSEELGQVSVVQRALVVTDQLAPDQFHLDPEPCPAP
mmetsp:Transcript_75911/g.235028  ORF Transcript_75911/g.235028 Transcript_75911/m.235028 type:complete len:227 (-) Transcript_75911:176-856(-)